MIATIDVEIQAANPNMPLYPWRAFKGSSTSLRIRNVPKKIGTWQIMSVDAQVEYPDNTILRKSAKLVGGVWVATLNGSSLSGLVTNGYSIIASGIDEDGNAIGDYILGKGDVEILDSDSIIEAGIKVNSVKIYDEAPNKPKDGDVWFNGDELVVFSNDEIYRFNNFVPTSTQQNALNSGITSTKVSNYDNVYNKVPVQTFEPENMLADKAFVNSSVQTATANFRGNWQTFEDVPADINDYPEDYLGIKTPSTNDYMVVDDFKVDTRKELRTNNEDNKLIAYINSFDTSTLTLNIEWADGNISEETAYDYGGEYQLCFYHGDYELIMYYYSGLGDMSDLSKWSIECYDYSSNTQVSVKIVSGLKESIGTWRFKYVGNWDVDGKNGWKQEYQVNETPMTADQLAALNSGVTKQAVQSISYALPKYKFIYPTQYSDVIELTPFTYTVVDGFEYSNFSITALPTNVNNAVREFGLVVKAIANIEWPSNFHPRTPDDLTVEMGVNIFWISEYLPNEFVFSKWSIKDDRVWHLCFTAEQPNSTIKMVYGSTVPSYQPEVSLLTSTDGKIWTPFIVDETIITLANVGDKVYFKAGEGGNKTLHVYDIPVGYASFTITGRIAASGSIMSLLNGEEYITEMTSDNKWCFNYLFKGCTSLTQAPELPATILADNCYEEMFLNCTNLTQAPELPATTLADNCYGQHVQRLHIPNPSTRTSSNNFS